MKLISGFPTGIWGVLGLLILLTVFSFDGGVWAAAPKGAAEEELKKITANIHWLGHDSFRIDGEGVVIYLDPYKLKEGLKADLILITHDHQDHASPADVARIRKSDTVIVTIAKAAEKLTGEIKTVKPGDELTVKGVKKNQGRPGLQCQQVPQPGRAFPSQRGRERGVCHHGQGGPDLPHRRF